MPSWALIEKDNTLLFIQRSEKTSRAGQWCFPGGGIKRNETPEAACIREAFEETGLNIKPVKLIARIQNQYFYQCKLINAESIVKLKHNECVDSAWVEVKSMFKLGIIMNIKMIVPLLNSLGYEIDVPTELRSIIENQ